MALTKNLLLDTPPFLTHLLVQIEESILLENYPNVVRLQTELISALCEYTGILGLSYLRKMNQMPSIGSLRHTRPESWITLLLNESHRFQASPDLKSLSEFQKCFYASLFKGLKNKEKEEVHKASSSFQELGLSKFEPENPLELLLRIHEVLEGSTDSGLLKSQQVLSVVAHGTSSVLELLLNRWSQVLSYTLVTVESFVNHASGEVSFLRAHHGNLVLPLRKSLESHQKIGSVLLMRESTVGEYKPLFSLSPFLIQVNISKRQHDSAGLAIYRHFQGNTARYYSFSLSRDIYNRGFLKDLAQFFTALPGFQFRNDQEQLYYHKLLEYWQDGIIDEQEEQAMQIMHKVFNIGFDRLQEIEKLVKKELGIPECKEQGNQTQTYRESFLELLCPKGIGPMERISLNDLSRSLSLRNTEIYKIEVDCYEERARQYIQEQNFSDLEDILIQLALIDFQNALVMECEQKFGINVSGHPLVGERHKSFQEYLGYLRVVYADGKVTHDERRFLEVQRKRLELSEREAFELEFLEENLVSVLQTASDDLHKMQQENFKLGAILLSHGMINEENLQRALEIQNRDPGTKLGALLYELGSISHEQLKRALEIQKHLVLKRGSRRLGDIALQFAFINKRQLTEALSTQEQYFQQNYIHKRLGDILLTQGAISKQALSFLLSIQSLSEDN